MTTGRPTADGNPVLLETLRLAQRFGVLGSRPVEEAVAHARAFTDALEPVHGRVVDLGAGGGLPGLVVAVEREDLEVVLIDRRQKRTDLLQRAVTKLQLDGRVAVVCDDARRLPVLYPGGFHGVTARGFGPPEVTLAVAAACLAPGGLIVISEPPTGDRWDPELILRLGLTMRRRPGVAVFEHRLAE